MSLPQKHRPENFDEIAGNEDVVRSLSSILARKREEIQHAFLFIGPPGCGKTTFGRITAKMLECFGADIHEVDTTLYRKTGDIEEILGQVWLSPMEGNFHCWILDEAHQIGTGGNSPTNKAQNALLKMLEEPPSHAYFILCTTNPEMLLDTIRSRCATFEVQPLGQRLMEEFLQTISRKERKRIPIDVIQQIAQDSLGSCRNALQILDKIIDLDPADMLSMAEQTAAKQNKIIDLCRALIGKQSWKNVAEILKNLEKESPESVRLAIRGYCGNVLLSGKDTAQAAIILDSFNKPFYTDGKNCLIESAYFALEGMK